MALEFTTAHWIVFNIFILAMLALDLGVFNKNNHEVKFKEAVTWSLVWVSLALIFNYGIYHFGGKDLALEFLTGYIIEKTLSVDNIFVFILIFSFFKVPKNLQHKVLFWGVIGALILRFIFIMLGASLIAQFHWIIYLFGSFLVFTGIKIAFSNGEDQDLNDSKFLKILKKIIPTTSSYHGNNFFIKENGKLLATPLFLTLMVVEFTDVIFAVDSIPAIFSITTNTFIVYTSNVFAILGLRSLFFLLANAKDKFHLLHYSLAFILTLVGVKMLVSGFYKLPISLSLGLIAGSLFISIVLSLVYPKKQE